MGNVIFRSYTHTPLCFKASTSLGCTKKECATACSLQQLCFFFFQIPCSLNIVRWVKWSFDFFLDFYSFLSAIYPKADCFWKHHVCPVSPSGLMWLLCISITSFTQLTAIGLCVNVCSCEWVSVKKKYTIVHINRISTVRRMFQFQVYMWPLSSYKNNIKYLYRVNKINIYMLKNKKEECPR